MKYVFTLLWAVLLVSMLNYVSGSIAGLPNFDFTAGIIAAIVMFIFVLIIANAFPDEPVTDHDAQ